MTHHLFGGFHGGWRPQLPGVGRNRAYKLRSPGIVYPASTNNRAKGLASIVDQGNLGSCTANAGAQVVNALRLRQGLAEVPLSRLALYYWTRVKEGTQGQDAGATIADTIATLKLAGIGPEADWPYDVTQFAVQPPGKEVIDALKELVLTDELIDNTDLTQIKDALFNGHVIDLGFTVMQSFQGIGADGLMPMPFSQEDVLGGHSVYAIDYDDAVQCPDATVGALLCCNSWGEAWGLGGRFWMPYQAATDADLAGDWWAVSSVSPT